MEENNLRTTVEDILIWSQDPIQMCAGQPIIPAYNFNKVADSVSALPGINSTPEEIFEVLKLQSQRFSACGANNSDKFGVLRRNPETHWKYLLDLIIK